MGKGPRPLKGNPTMDKSSILKKVRALLNLTKENGASENESLQAAAKARELMDLYHISADQVGLEDIGKETLEEVFTFSTIRPIDRLAPAVAKFCDCRVWREDQKIIFFGLLSDTIFASWLGESLNEFCVIHTMAYQKVNKKSVAEAKLFLLGMVDRIHQRLVSEAKLREANQPQMASGRGLVVVKNGVVNSAFEALGLNLRKAPKGKAVDGSSKDFQAGASAGEKANFSRPVEGGRKMIGNR